MVAAEGGHLSIVDCLLKRGADVNMASEVYRTIL